MKNSNLVIRTQRLLPEVYSDESRDFQLFTKLMDAVYNSCKFNTDGILYTSDPKNINDRLLKLLADKIGVETLDSDQLSNEEIRQILQCLPNLLRYKGSLQAIIGMINLYFKIYHINGNYKLSVSNGSTIIQDVTLSERTIILGLETIKQSTTFLNILAKYLLPPGYKFFVYFYSTVTGNDQVYYEDNIQLLYTDNILASEIDQEIPDFIADIMYDWTDIDISGDDPAIPRNGRIQHLISAVDAHTINSIYSKYSKEYFLGYVNENYLNTLQKNFEEAKAYKKDRDPLEIENPTDSYQPYDVVLKGDIHYCLVPEYKLFGESPINVFNTREDFENTYPDITTIEFYAEDILYRKGDYCLYNNSLYQAKETIDPAEPGQRRVFDLSQWRNIISNNNIIAIKSDEKYNNEHTYNKYVIKAASETEEQKKEVIIIDHKYNLYWSKFEEGSIIIVDETTNGKFDTGISYTTIGEIYFVTTANKKSKKKLKAGTTCIFNKLNFKGSYIQPINTKPTDILPATNTTPTFDYYCLLTQETPFLHKTDSEIALNPKPAVKQLPTQVFENDLRYCLTNSNYYVGINGSLNGENICKTEDFADSEIQSGIRFQNVENKEGKLTGVITVTGVSTALASHNILRKSVQIKKDNVYYLTGCDLYGRIDSYYLQLGSDAFDSKTNPLIDIGTGVIGTATCDDARGAVTIWVQPKVDVLNAKFTPELYNLTAIFGKGKEPQSVEELLEKLWRKVKEGPTLQDQELFDFNAIPNNSIVWRRGGNYYINYKGNWQKYTNPLFIIKVLQTRSINNE